MKSCGLIFMTLSKKKLFNQVFIDFGLHSDQFGFDFRFQFFLMKIKGLQYIYKDFFRAPKGLPIKKLFNQVNSLTRSWG